MEDIPDFGDSKTMLELVEEDNNNQGNEEEQDDDGEVFIESNNMISNVNAVNSQPAYGSDSTAKFELIAKDGNLEHSVLKKASRKKVKCRGEG